MRSDSAAPPPPPRAVIMAGGEGTRLRPFTHTIPKPLLPIGRKPIAQHIVERLRDCGIRHITMTLEYGADLIRAFFQDGSQFGVEIDYFHEPRKLGTAGCLAHIAHLRQAPFLVTNGDILTDLDYAEFLSRHAGAAMTVVCRRGEVAIPYGVLHLDGARAQIDRVEEKPTIEYVFNAGIYAISPQALQFIPKDAAFPMTDLITALRSAGHGVAVHHHGGLWHDLAKTQDFDRALEELEALEARNGSGGGTTSEGPVA